MLRPPALLFVCLLLGSSSGVLGEEDASRNARFVRWEGPPVSVVTAISDRAFQLSEVLQRTARFFSAIATSYEDENEIDREDNMQTKVTPDEDTPSTALHGMYTECVLRLSIPCIQNKLMLFIDRLGRIDKFRLLGDFLSVVRVEPRQAGDSNYTSDSEDGIAERFFETHSVRFSLPGTLRIARSPGLRTTVDLHFSKVIPDKNNVGEGRGPLSGGGGGNTKKKQKMLKKIKKRLMKLLMMLMSVMMVMGPMMGGMAGGQAMLAILMGSLSLLISKALIIKKLGGSVSGLVGNIGSSIGNLAGIAGGGGGGGLGGGGGGASSYFPSSTGGGPYSRIDPVAVDWARSFGSVVGGSFDPLSLAYNAYNLASSFR